MFHEVIQVIPHSDFTVTVYFVDGIIKRYDVKPLLTKGVFRQLSDITVFMESCTVMNHTLAWDIKGNRDPYACIDIAPETIYEEGIRVPDPLVS